MDHVRTVVTARSVWKFDTELRRYVRFPRTETGHHPELPYTLVWEPYVRLERAGDVLVVHRPVQWGRGARRVTSPIEHDDLRPEDLDQSGGTDR